MEKQLIKIATEKKNLKKKHNNVYSFKTIKKIFN